MKRHRWRGVLEGELVEYGSGLAERHRCRDCGIFRFVSDRSRDARTWYAEVRTPRGGRSNVRRRWDRSPGCPPRADAPPLAPLFDGG